MAVIIALIVLSIAIPVAAVKRDKRDYEDLKKDIYDVDDEFMKRYAREMKLPLEQVLYKKKLIAEL